MKLIVEEQCKCTRRLFHSPPNKYTEGPDGLPCKIIKQAKDIVLVAVLRIKGVLGRTVYCCVWS